MILIKYLFKIRSICVLVINYSYIILYMLHQPEVKIYLIYLQV